MIAHSVLAVFTSKEPRHRNKSDGRGINISGVDFWHAVEFSRNGRFLQAALASSPGASFFRVSSLSDVFRSVFRSFTHPTRFPSAFRRFRLYQILSAPIFAGAVRAFGPFRVSNLTRSVSVSGPLLERGWPSRLSPFRPFRLYQIRFRPLPVRIRFRFRVGVTTVAEFLGDS